MSLAAFPSLADEFASLCGHRRWIVGLSGGADSVALLHLAREFLAGFRGDESRRPSLAALHVNHRLHGDSGRWQMFCEGECEKNNIPLVCEGLRLARGDEAHARKARYRVFERHLGKGDALLLAHHQDDQLETFLFRLCRGAGIPGLAAMEKIRPLGGGVLARPLLPFTRGHLREYLRARDLSWCEDGGNADTALARNYLRHEILPKIEARWPGYRRTWARAITHLRDSREIQRELARDDMREWGETLSLRALESVSPARQGNLLYHWLQWRGLTPPPAAQLREFLRQVGESRAEAQPALYWPEGELHRYRGVLHAFPPMPPPPERAVPWDLKRPLRVPGMGEVRAEPAAGGMLLKEPVQVRFRTGAGEVSSLKKLFQRLGLPPWLRARVPLMYQAGTLAAVGDLWVAPPFVGSERADGWLFHWSPPASRPPAPES